MEQITTLLCLGQLSIIIQTLLLTLTVLSYAATSPSVFCGEDHYYNDRHEKCLEKCGNDTRCGLNQVCDLQQERCLDLCGENDTIPCNYTQYCDRDLRICSEKCGIHPGCKAHQSCDRQHGNCLDLCGENDTFTCDVTQHCDRNLGICLDRCGPDNNFKCRQLEYCDREREVCLDLCGPDDQVRCREDEYCDTLRKVPPECANICFEECNGSRDNPAYCDTQTSKCEPCHHICDPYHIGHFPDCKIFCNDVYKAVVDKPNGSLTSDAVFLDFTTAAIIGVVEHRSSNNAQIIGGIVGSLALVMLCVLAYLRFKKKSTRKGKSPPWVICGGRKGNTHESESTPSDPDGNRQDTTESSQLVLIHPNQDAGPEDTGLLQSHHGSSISVPLNSVTPSDCLNPPTSCRASVNSHGSRNPSLSTAGPKAGGDGAVSFDNMPSRTSVDKSSAELTFISNGNAVGYHPVKQLLNDSDKVPSLHSGEEMLLPKRKSQSDDDGVSRNNDPNLQQQYQLPLSHHGSQQSVCSDTNSLPKFKDTASIHVSLDDVRSLQSEPDVPLVLHASQTSISHSHDSIVGNSDLDLDGAHAKSPLEVEEKLKYPEQDTNHHDWRDVLQKWRPHGDLDLREDGNLPEDDTVSGFEDIYPGNPGAAVAAAAAAAAPVAAVPPPLQPIVPQELPIGARNIGPGVNVFHLPHPNGPEHNGMVNSLDGAHAKSPLKVEEQLTVPQQDTTPHDRDRRGIVHDYLGGDDTGIGDDDPLNLGEAAALQELPGNIDDLMREHLAPHQRADVDERANISQIILSFHFVVYHLFMHDTVTVCVRPSDITLGEAKRLLIEAGVPEEMLEVELFSIDSA